MNMDELIKWAIWLGTAAFGAIAVVMKWLWGKVIAGFAECETDRKGIRLEVQGLKESQGAMREVLAVFEGCQTEKCGAAESLARRKKFQESYHLVPGKRPQPRP